MSRGTFAGEGARCVEGGATGVGGALVLGGRVFLPSLRAAVETGLSECTMELLSNVGRHGGVPSVCVGGVRYYEAESLDVATRRYYEWLGRRISDE